MSSFFKSLLVSARLPVLPSVFSHGLMGILLTLPTGWGGEVSGSFLWGAVLGACVFFYLAGMWGNDAKDALWDQKNRPERPIPQAWISAKKLGSLALVSGLLGALCVVLLSGGNGGRVLCVSLLLLADIVAYTFWHKVWRASAFFMGGARVLLVFVCASACSPFSWGEFSGIFYGYLLFLFLYVSFLTYFAQKETLFVGRQKQVGLLLSCMPLWDALWLLALGFGLWALMPVCFFGLSLGLRAFKWQTT